MLLNEDASMVQIPKPVDKSTVRTLKLFQQVLGIVFDAYHGHQMGGDKRGSLVSDQRFKAFKRKIAQYKDVPFVKPVFDQIAELNQQFIAKRQGARTTRHLDLTPHINKAMDAWRRKDMRAILQSKTELTTFTRALAAKGTDPLDNSRNPFYIENPLFFISARFLNAFEKDQIQTVIGLDLQRFQYSYLPLPKEKLDNFEYLAYYMLRLKDDDNPVTVTGSDVNKYFDMAYSGSEYETLISNVQRYLHDNDKTLIPGILAEIEKYPEIKALNDRAKQEITIVYRGVGGEGSLERILTTDKKNRFVATSTSKRAAKNFAMQIGHLESSDMRRTEDAVLITYSVGPESVLLDTTIFGGVFGEGEVLIDASKASLEDVEFV